MNCELLITELRTLANQYSGELFTTCGEAADTIAALRAEVERLRADYAELHRAFWLLRRVTLPPHDISGTSMWGEALSIANALPAPPDRDWHERKIPHDDGEVGAGVPAPPVEEE